MLHKIAQVNQRIQKAKCERNAICLWLNFTKVVNEVTVVFCGSMTRSLYLH